MHTRRDFMLKSALMGAFSGLLGPRMLFAEGRPAPLSSPFHVSVFSKPLQWLDYGVASELLAAAGYDGIEYSVRPGGHVLPEQVETELPKAIKAAHKAGLKANMIVTNITDVQEPHAQKILQVAADNGVEYYRMGYYFYDRAKPPLAVMEEAKSKFVKLAELNEKIRIKGCYQNHVGNMVGGSLWELMDMLKAVNPAWTGLQYDIRHAVADAGFSWAIPLRQLSEWVHTLVVKDFQWQFRDNAWRARSIPLGQDGMVNYEVFLKMLKELGISAPISLHIEYPLFPENAALSQEEKRAASLEVLKSDRQVLARLIEQHYH